MSFFKDYSKIRDVRDAIKFAGENQGQIRASNYDNVRVAKLKHFKEKRTKLRILAALLDSHIKSLKRRYEKSGKLEEMNLLDVVKEFPEPYRSWALKPDIFDALAVYIYEKVTGKKVPRKKSKTRVKFFTKPEIQYFEELVKKAQEGRINSVSEFIEKFREKFPDRHPNTIRTRLTTLYPELYDRLKTRKSTRKIKMAVFLRKHLNKTQKKKLCDFIKKYGKYKSSQVLKLHYHTVNTFWNTVCVGELGYERQ